MSNKLYDNITPNRLISVAICTPVLAAFVFCLYVQVVCNDRHDNKHTTKQQIAQIDKEIKKAHNKIDSLRRTTQDRTIEMSKLHPEYSALIQAPHYIDSLNNANDSILHTTRAHVMRRVTLNTPYYDERIFSQHRDMPFVNRAAKQFNKNKQKIQHQSEQLTRLHKIQMSAFDYIRSSNYRQISALQKSIDSMLIRKDSLITKKIR